MCPERITYLSPGIRNSNQMEEPKEEEEEGMSELWRTHLIREEEITFLTDLLRFADGRG